MVQNVTTSEQSKSAEVVEPRADLRKIERNFIEAFNGNSQSRFLALLEGDETVIPGKNDIGTYLEDFRTQYGLRDKNYEWNPVDFEIDEEGNSGYIVYEFPDYGAKKLEIKKT